MARFINLLSLLLLQLYFQVAVSLPGSIVEFLPGFDGPLPFQLQTGYIGVGESEDVQLFYYFIKSESNPEKDPLLFWLTGGPGCTGLSALVYEIGPINFKEVSYDGSLPKFVLNPHSWTKVASIIFVDAPVDTGFSYVKTIEISQSDDIKASDQNYEFLRKWLVEYPEYISNPLYIGGDSYSGMIAPIVTQLISNGNEAGIEPLINLKGYLLGNPLTCPADDHNYDVQFAHGMGLISDELYETLKGSCKGKYHDIDPSNALCKQNMKTFNLLLDGINSENIVANDIPTGGETPSKLLGGSRALYETFHDQRIRSPFERNGTIGEWRRCNPKHVNYTETVTNVVPYHANLSIKGYRALIYSGDHDMVVPHISTQAWIRSLNYSIVDEWRQWIFDGQVAGYTRTYANQMTFATVKGGGHIAPEYKPAECKAMFERWLASQPL